MRPLDTRSVVTILAVLAAAQSCRPMSAGSTQSAGGAPQIRYQGDFRAPLGVQLWSFREQAKADPIAMLNMVRRMGLTHVETAGLYNMTAEQFADAIKKAGLKVTSMHVSYEDLRD